MISAVNADDVWSFILNEESPTDPIALLMRLILSSLQMVLVDLPEKMMENLNNEDDCLCWSYMFIKSFVMSNRRFFGLLF